MSTATPHIRMRYDRGRQQLQSRDDRRRSASSFTFASTCSVYGDSDEILDERSALNPLSL